MGRWMDEEMAVEERGVDEKDLSKKSEKVENW